MSFSIEVSLSGVTLPSIVHLMSLPAGYSMVMRSSSGVPEQMSPVIVPFVVVWGLLGVGSFLFLHYTRDAAPEAADLALVLRGHSSGLCGFCLWDRGAAQSGDAGHHASRAVNHHLDECAHDTFLRCLRQDDHAADSFFEGCFLLPLRCAFEMSPEGTLLASRAGSCP